MIIDVLVCQADGSQILEQREVPDNYFDVQDAQAEPQV